VLIDATRTGHAGLPQLPRPHLPTVMCWTGQHFLSSATTFQRPFYAKLSPSYKNSPRRRHFASIHSIPSSKYLWDS